MIKHIFFVFFAINVTSTLFCAYENFSEKDLVAKDPFSIYSTFPGVFNYLSKKGKALIDHGDDFQRELLESCPHELPPMAFSKYCKEHAINESCVINQDWCGYIKKVLEPWAIEKRQKQLPRPMPKTFQFALYEALNDVLLPAVIGIVESYDFRDPMLIDYGIDRQHQIIIRRLKYQSDLMLMVSPTATFDEFLFDVAKQSEMNVDCIGLHSQRSNGFPLIKSMQDLVYRYLLGPKGYLLLQKVQKIKNVEISLN